MSSWNRPWNNVKNRTPGSKRAPVEGSSEEEATESPAKEAQEEQAGTS